MSVEDGYASARLTALAIVELSTGAQALLASTSAAHLAYAAKDGTPQVVPVGYFWTGEEFVVSTAPNAPKLAALSAHPDVALTIDGGDDPDQARTLSIRGTARVTIIDGVVPEYLAAARKSMDAKQPLNSRSSLHQHPPAGGTPTRSGGEQVARRRRARSYDGSWTGRIASICDGAVLQHPGSSECRERPDRARGLTLNGC